MERDWILWLVMIDRETYQLNDFYKIDYYHTVDRLIVMGKMLKERGKKHRA